MDTFTPAFRTLITLCLLTLLSIQARPGAATPDTTAVSRTRIYMGLRYPGLFQPVADRDMQAALSYPAFAKHSSTAPSFLGGPSPLDTLQMSLLEKVFWRRHGLFRVTGLFKPDRETPTNDFRRIGKIRRKMLGIHQTLGLVTVASMAVTVIGGQRAFDGKGSGLHKTSLPVTIGLYSTTAFLALASPPRLFRAGGGVDTITFHKVFAAIHLAGMIITPMLAPNYSEGDIDSADIHRVFGYATFAAFSAGMLVVTLFN